LERNDAMGMAVGLKSRFPMLDGKILRLAVGVPLSFKLRFSPDCRDTQRMFVCDKWLLRQVALRYLPPEYCLRRKRPFPTDAFARLQIDRDALKDSFVTNLLELSKLESRKTLENASQKLLLRLLHLDIWGRLFILSDSPSSVTTKLSKTIKVAA
jgi:asparagine synthase (glutamine-hydrolysing)